jgi:hypothetical protein
MKKRSKRWQDVLQGRFCHRENLGKSELYKRYWQKQGLPEAAVLECLEFIEEEYEISSGVLRPEDHLQQLFEPVATRNPLKWLEYETGAEDRKSELNYQLAKRMGKHGTLGTWKNIDTIDDLVRAWCGLGPKT